MVVLDYDSHGVPDVENRREIGKLNTWRKLIKGGKLINKLYVEIRPKPGGDSILNRGEDVSKH